MEQCYLGLRIWYGKETGYRYTELATDEFIGAEQDQNPYFSSYADIKENVYSSPKITTGGPGIWDEFYRGVINCNAVINLIDNSGFPASTKTQMKAEAHFLRAVYYYLITEIWGGVMFTLQNEPINSNSFSVITVEESYNQIISDLKWADDNIQPVNNDFIYLSKDAAKAMLARIYLTIKDYTNANFYAQSVINSGNHKLLNSYDSIFYIYNEKNDEIIFSVNYSFDTDPLNYYFDNFAYGYQKYMSADLREGGSQGHLMFGTFYHMIPGMQRDIINGRPFRRYMPTPYLISCFNDNLDKRWKGTFKTTWICNDENYIPKWPIKTINYSTTWLPNDSLFGKPLYKLGDTSFVMLKNEIPDSLKISCYDYGSGLKIHKYKHYFIFDIKSFYSDETKNAQINAQGSQNRQLFYELKKFADSTRLAADFTGSERSQKDAYIIRFAEIFLIAAEANYYLGNKDAAYNNLIQLANVRAINKNGIEMVAAYGVNSPTDIDIEFLLDERTREFAGEQLRWFDLKRTGKLVEHIQKYNEDAKDNIQEFHNVKPIPIYFPELIYTSDDLQQNPGY